MYVQNRNGKNAVDRQLSFTGLLLIVKYVGGVEMTPIVWRRHHRLISCSPFRFQLVLSDAILRGFLCDVI